MMGQWAMVGGEDCVGACVCVRCEQCDVGAIIS